MQSFDKDRTPMADREALMERSLIDEFLQAHGLIDAIVRTESDG